MYLGDTKELEQKKPIKLPWGDRQSRLGPSQKLAVLIRPELRASLKLAESPVMIIKSVFSISICALLHSHQKIWGFSAIVGG